MSDPLYQRQTPSWRTVPIARFGNFVRRWPFLSLYGLALLSNVAGSAFSFMYNTQLIVARMDENQQAAFWNVAGPLYNVLAYPLCLGIMIYVIAPLRRCRRQLVSGKTISPAFLELSRRRLVNLPFFQVCVNLLGWLPGMVFFPLVVCVVGGTNQAGVIWLHFGISFLVTALFTTAQTFFLLEAYLRKFFYPAFFQDARPAEIRGAIRISFGVRLLVLWLAVAVMPLVALLTVALNFARLNPSVQSSLTNLALIVGMLGVVSGGVIFRVVGNDLMHWLRLHASATEEIAVGNFEVRVPEKRPDAFGSLTDAFNDMAGALARGRQLRETFGQFVSPEVRDDIMERFHGFEVNALEITVLFVDIRGFSRRCATQAPEKVGELLNRFLSLAVGTIEDKGGFVNKFLGDGVMALFGATRRREDHADVALASARKLVEKLRDLNADLTGTGEEPLVIGIGIHTGTALVGCFGSREKMRREFTAIGETVNLSQRLEQLTKECGGPILVSAQTAKQLRGGVKLEYIGPKRVAGFPEPVMVHRVIES